jgi:hypothetical protein
MVISGDNDTLVYTGNERKQGATQEKEAGFQERDKDKKEIDQEIKKENKSGSGRENRKSRNPTWHSAYSPFPRAHC